MLSMDEEEKCIFDEFYFGGYIRGRFYLEFPVGIKDLFEELHKRVNEEKLSKAVGEEPFNEETWRGLLSGKLNWIDTVCVESPKCSTGVFEEDVIEIGRKVQRQIVTTNGWKIFKKEFEKVFFNQKVWIIEIEKTLNPEGICQVLKYSSMFRRDWNLKPNKGIVCNTATTNFLKTCEEYNIQVWQIQPF